jgi:MFS family permease
MNSAPTSTAASSSLLAQRPFVFIWLARVASSMGVQMLALTIAWKLYQLTNSALDLGLIGLIQFVPAALFTLLIGHVADRYDRRLIIRSAQAIAAIAAAVVTVALATDTISPEILFAAVFLIGCARAFEAPATSALVPSLVPPPLVTRAVAGWASANQIAVITGPALGGLIYAVSPVAVSTLCVVLFSVAITFVSLIHIAHAVTDKREPPTFRSVLAGFHYVHSRSRLLGVITLDLFVVLLGGATALLPVYARDILMVGPTGLGLLRSAPAAGALLSALWLSRRPIESRIGPKMFASVAIFGLATVVFALSHSFPLSLAALAVLGASDAVSVVIRFSLVQIETPDAMRGRVSAINYLFVSSSNTLGEFESGTVAAWLGAVPSVLIGGIGSLLVALAWMLLFPALRKIDRFELADEQSVKT